jgi:hypothetical protein
MDHEAHDEFGKALALDGAGTLLAVGARFSLENKGAVYIYIWTAAEMVVAAAVAQQGTVPRPCNG